MLEGSSELPLGEPMGVDEGEEVEEEEEEGRDGTDVASGDGVGIGVSTGPGGDGSWYRAHAVDGLLYTVPVHGDVKPMSMREL